MNYVALLRGINVGGNNKIKMVDLKKSFEDLGFTQVTTYIQSGNVIFESDDSDIQRLTKKIEKMLTDTFRYKARVLLLTKPQMEQVVANIPNEWKTREDLRCYIAFLMNLKADDAVKGIDVREGVDSLQVGPGVLYMTTLMSERTKSAFTKLIGTKIFQETTIRNFNTTRKLLTLLE